MTSCDGRREEGAHRMGRRLGQGRWISSVPSRRQEINYFKRADISQNTPLLVVIRLMVSLAASVVDAAGMHHLCMAVWDCCHAFYHAAINEEIYAIPPRGLAPPGYLWRLHRAMNGTRAASRAYGDLVSNVVVLNCLLWEHLC